MRIEPARQEYVPAIAALERVCFPADPWPEDLIGRLRENFTAALDDDGTLAGYLVLSSVLDEGDIDNVAVAPAYRRRGLGDALVEDAVRRGRERGLSFLALEVRAGNGPALRLYEKHGFRTVGRRKNYYEKPREDAILMTLVLSTC
jgi:ribosomal-protein-alanine N-acetyltransferase